jgi:hypothetical protein
VVWVSQSGHPREAVCDRCAAAFDGLTGAHLSVAWPMQDSTPNAYGVDLCGRCRLQFEAWMLPPPPIERCA